MLHVTREIANDVRGLTVANTGDRPTIYMYDEIGPGWAGMIDDNAMLSALQEIGEVDDLDLRINSPGGVVDIGSTIFNLLVDHPANIHVRIDGIAASIASVIAMAGNTITVSANSRFMIHEAMTLAWGNKQTFAKIIDMLGKADEGIVGTYVERTGNDKDKVVEWMKAETWFTADEAIDAGFATEKAPSIKNVSMKIPANRYKNAPKNLETYDREIPGIQLSKPPGASDQSRAAGKVTGNSKTKLIAERSKRIGGVDIAARLAAVRARI